MAWSQGRFCWYELMTTEPDAAKRFYGAVMGWANEKAPVSDSDYSLFTADATPVAGVMDMPETCREAGIPAGWTGYVAVDDVDASAQLAVELGGVLRMPPTDIPDIGRFAVITDPQGARIALFRAVDQNQEGPPPQYMPGGIGWHELWATDGEAAFAYYNRLCGWQKAESMDMGEMGTYQMFAVDETTLGGIFTKPSSVSAPFWLYYFNVGDIDAGAARVVESGGRITKSPMSVPGGGWILHGIDPQGAAFALYGHRAEELAEDQGAGA